MTVTQTRSAGGSGLCLAFTLAIPLTLAIACSSTSDDHPASAPDAGGDDGAAPGSVTAQILAINDFHGALDSPPGNSTPYGGAAWLAAHVARLRAAPSIFVSAGDLVGASPLASGLFHDEPTIEVMNAMGLDLNGVGNHEFDEGLPELHRLQSGGCHPVDGCKSAATFPGAKFHFLAANVREEATGQTIFPPYEVRDLGGVKLAFIGMTLKDTPATTLLASTKGLAFADEVATVAALVPELRAQGVAGAVVLVHQGGAQAGTYDGCDAMAGPIVDLAERFDDLVKVVVSGHTHEFYDCTIAGKHVTSAGSNGLGITDVRVTVDVASNTVTGVTSKNILIKDDAVTPDPTVAAIVAANGSVVAPVRDAVVGTITRDLSNGVDGTGESPLGDVVCDAMLAKTGADVALMNTGGLREPLVFARSGAETVDGQITYGEAFATEPFGNQLVTVDLSGADLLRVLQASVSGSDDQVQVGGLTFVASSAMAPTDVTVGGAALSPTATYKVTTNTFLAEGGSAILTTAPGHTDGGNDLDAFVAYLKAHSPVAPPASKRITTR